MVKPGAKVKLTDYVRSAGCASKIGQKDLHAVLAGLPVVKDPRILVGMATADDAGVFRLASGVTVVQTVDVFTPGVDDPYLFGRIAACNSLSDVYAMGGTPVTALSVIGFPIERLPHEVMSEILRGGMDVLKEAGVILLGGHSINDEEVKFGFAVTGVISESAVVTNAGARPGDALILTKPLGTGIVSLANQIGKASPESVKAAEVSMSSLNRAASEIMVRHHATACTDVTGFGFLGHLCQVVMESGVTAEIWFGRLPLLPGVMDYAERGIFSGANERNSEYSSARTRFEDGLTDVMKAVLFDAQTSGGLLMAVPAAEADATLKDLHDAGIKQAAIVGEITEKSKGLIRVLPDGSNRKTGGHGKVGQRPQPNTGGLRSVATGVDGATPSNNFTARVYHPLPERSKNHEKETNMTKEAKKKEEGCCAHGNSAPSDNTLAVFQDFMGAAMAPGALDVVTKELMAIALGLAVHCVPCSKIHIKKAKSMGIGVKEMEEAAALAVGFSGCRALMLWNELKKELLP